MANLSDFHACMTVAFQKRQVVHSLLRRELASLYFVFCCLEYEAAFLLFVLRWKHTHTYTHTRTHTRTQAHKHARTHAQTSCCQPPSNDRVCSGRGQEGQCVFQRCNHKVSQEEECCQLCVVCVCVCLNVWLLRGWGEGWGGHASGCTELADKTATPLPVSHAGIELNNVSVYVDV